GLGNGYFRELLALPANAVVIEPPLPPFGANRSIPEKGVVDADVEGVAAGDLAMIGEKRVGAKGPQTLALVGHEDLVAGDHFFGRDQAAFLHLELLFLRLESLDRDARVLQDLGTLVQENRDARRIGLEVRLNVPDGTRGPSHDVVDDD